MHFKKLLVTAMAGALLLSGCAAGGKTAVSIGDSVITANEIKFTAQELMGSANVASAVDALKQSYLIAELAENMGIELSDEEVSSIKQNIASFKANQGGKKAGDKLLKSYGVDDSILFTISSASLYSQKVFEQLEITDPTDDELRSYFKNSYLRAKHVLISTTDMVTGADLDEGAQAEAEITANEVLEKAKDGEDFDALIEEFNEDPGMASNEDGYFFTDKQMVQEFEDATKSIQPDEFTLCKSDYGYHIIQRLPIEGDSFDKYFEDNKVSVQSSYSSVQQQNALDSKAEELGITTEVKQNVIDSIKLDDSNNE